MDFFPLRSLAEVCGYVISVGDDQTFPRAVSFVRQRSIVNIEVAARLVICGQPDKSRDVMAGRNLRQRYNWTICESDDLSHSHLLQV